jgi:hypothetical protein
VRNSGKKSIRAPPPDRFWIACPAQGDLSTCKGIDNPNWIACPAQGDLSTCKGIDNPKMNAPGFGGQIILTIFNSPYINT